MFDLAGIGISLLNRKSLEVLYVSVDNLSFGYTDSPAAQEVHLAVGAFQIDNQLHDAIYPVVLQPTPVKKESSAVAALPTIQASVALLKDQGKKQSDSNSPLSSSSSARCTIHQILLRPSPSAHY